MNPAYSFSVKSSPILMRTDSMIFSAQKLMESCESGAAPKASACFRAKRAPNTRETGISHILAIYSGFSCAERFWMEVAKFMVMRT